MGLFKPLKRDIDFHRDRLQLNKIDEAVDDIAERALLERAELMASGKRFSDQ